jgi:DNA (cytosine-5)-methyltransferase 1
MTKKLKVLDLFSGLGGFSLGLERTGHFETVAFCDNDKFSKLILDKHWKGKKVYEDVREITKEKLIADGIELPDVVTGGFPCQPFSVAGKQKGTSDDRHLWPEMFRIIKTLQPRIVVGENVRGIVNIQDGMVFETVCTNLEDEGYEVQAFNIPAAGVGAPHRRERIWFIATLVDTIGNDERREISRSDEEERRIQEEYRTEHSTTRKSSRTSEIRNGDNGYESVENSNNNGFERGFSEARNETITGEKSSSNGSEDTDNSSRRSDGRGDQIQPRTDGTIQGLRNGDEEESSRATGVRGLHEGTDIGQGTIREDRDNKDDNRTLVQTRQSRVQSSEHRGLGENKTSLENNQVRQRDDSSSLDRMETRFKINVANTNDEGVRTRIGGSDNDYETESRSRGTDGGRSTSDDERHNIASTEIKKVDVANTESFGSRETRYSDQEERSEGSRATQLDGSCGDVANANGERSQRTKQSETHRGETETQLSTTQSITTEGNHWEFEPDVGRVAYGVPGRVHRLKALGNSIVPKIVEEIGYALIKGMK